MTLIFIVLGLIVLKGNDIRERTLVTGTFQIPFFICIFDPGPAFFSKPQLVRLQSEDNNICLVGWL